MVATGTTRSGEMAFVPQRATPVFGWSLTVCPIWFQISATVRDGPTERSRFVPHPCARRFIKVHLFYVERTQQKTIVRIFRRRVESVE
jgi:hypothetical protein